MPSMCVAFGCFSRGGHRFPKDEDMRKRWCVALKREKFVPKRESRVCSEHFLDSDYLREGFDSGLLLSKRSLKKDAVPSVFSWKKQLDLSQSKEREARKRRREDITKDAPTAAKRLDRFREEVHHTTDGCFSSVFEDACESRVSLEITDECVHIGNEIEVMTSVTECVDMPKNVPPCGSSDAQPSFKRPKNRSSVKVPLTAVCTVSVGTQTYQKSSFSFHKLKSNPEAVKYYTGMESFEKLSLVLYSLGPAAYELNYRYSAVENISVEDQFLLTLVKLRRAIPDLGLAFMFDVSKKTVQNIFVTWINFMYYEWSGIDIWPSKDLILYYMPDGFKKMYPSTRVIVDGTEFPVAASKNPVFQQAAFSTYKNRTTLKTLVGVTPSGLISHISPAYAGSVSDRAIVERSDLPEKCDPGDSIMADRGFTVQDILAPKHVTVNMPAFLKGKTQLPGVTLLKDRKLASKRVHVERVIGLVKTYTLLKHELPAHYVPLGTEIFHVICILCNFREGIVGRQA